MIDKTAADMTLEQWKHWAAVWKSQAEAFRERTVVWRRFCALILLINTIEAVVIVLLVATR